ncbi:hypothetical protein ACFQMH_24960 [Streptomyces viridiviolaceus]|uniref:Uncharacterized protein n=1 Tax=Streptomyces viridiviolaceus TaxID=68282 RepID=A0ABW2E9L5_9ACTN|nr:hypothetical protein [Streptomyces viridiviolaceus]
MAMLVGLIGTVLGGLRCLLSASCRGHWCDYSEKETLCDRCGKGAGHERLP